MVGYTELSLKTGHKGVTDSYVRHMQPSSVKPSFGEGVLLDPVALADEQELEKWAISYSVKAIRPQDIGVRFSDVLQFETSQEAVDNDSSWLNRYGEFTVMPSNAPSILGEKPVTVQFASLRNIVKTT
jgi:nitrogenase molybdenum-iron protein alpha/beta subunit